MEITDWIPALSAIGGAIVGGGVSALVQWLSSKHQISIERLKWREQNRRWAIEREISEFRELFELVEHLSDAISQMRIRKARERFEGAHQFVSAEQAKSDFENQIWAAKRSLMLMDDESLEWVEKFNVCYNDWYLSIEQQKGIDALMVFEATVEDFRQCIAVRYRRALERMEQEDL